MTGLDILKKFLSNKSQEDPAIKRTLAREVLADVRAEKLTLAEIRPETLRQASDQELLNLHLRTHQWYANQTGDESVFNAHLYILSEMLRRGLKHRVTGLDTLDRQTFERNPELLEQFRTLLGHDVQEVKDLSPQTRRMLEQLDDIVLVPGYVSMTGSSVYPEVYREGCEPNDIDLVVRSSVQNPIAEFKLARFFEHLTDKPLHWVYSPEGPCFTHVPVYDLVLRRRRPLRVETVDTFETRERFYKESIEPLRPFKPYDVAGDFFLHEDEEELREWVEERLPVVVQQKFDGLRMLVHKKGNEVAIYTEDELRDRSELFPNLVKKLQELPYESLILDTEFVEWAKDMTKPLPRPEMIWVAVAKPTEEYLERAKRVVVNVHDLIYLNNEDLSQKPYTERLEKLESLKLPESFKVVESKIVNNIGELDAALNWARELEGSEGAMIKAASFVYTPGKPNPDVAKFKTVIEIDCVIIGFRKAPKARPADEHWTVEEANRRLPKLLEESKTYFFRCAIRAGDELIPIESKSKLSPSDLHFRWNVEKQTWEGDDDPSQWHMMPSFEHREAGEYKYATTYAIALDEEPEFGMIVTVAPTEFTPFDKNDEEGNFTGYGYSWTFPRIRGFKPKSSPPAELKNVLAAFGYDPKKFSRYSPLTKQEPDTEEEQRLEEVLTHEEQRRLAETQFGDPYMIHQEDAKTYSFVVQRHTRGIFSPKQLEEANKAYEEATANEEAWNDFVKKYDFETFKSEDPVDKILKELHEKLEEARTSREVQKVLKDTLRPASFGTPKERLVQRGNAHTDLRLKSPDGDYLIGWTLDTPSIALQFLNSKIEWPMRDKFTEYKVEAEHGKGIENILTQRKSVQPEEWITYVTPEKPIIELEPREVGATPGAGARYDYMGRGQYVAGVQKSDYHEYFLFFDEPKLKKLNGRWGVQLITGPFEDIGRFAWITNRPLNQAPYITTHDKEKEEEKARREKVNMIWNGDTLEALKKLGFSWKKIRKIEYNKFRREILSNDFLVAQQVSLDNVQPQSLKVFALEGYNGIYEVTGEFIEPIPDPTGEGTKEKGVIAYLFDPKLWTKEDAKEFLEGIGANQQIEVGGELVSNLVQKRNIVEFCKINEEKRLVTGVVLEPFKVDAQGDWETLEDIETAMVKFMENSGKLGFMHKEFDRRFKLIENYIAPVDIPLGKQHITKGSWIMTVKVYDDEVWTMIKEGKIIGFSIAGKGKRVES